MVQQNVHKDGTKKLDLVDLDWPKFGFADADTFADDCNQLTGYWSNLSDIVRMCSRGGGEGCKFCSLEAADT